MTATVVLIHGAWMSPASWAGWIARFEARGHRVIAPPWPSGVVGITEIVAAYERVIDGLDLPPIVVGHSFGGLFTQMLLDRGRGAVGVAIDPAPMQSVLPGPNAVRASLPALLAWNAWASMRTMSFASFQWGWVHTLPLAEQRAAYDRYVVPTSGRIFFEALAAPVTNVTRVGDGRRVPLLLIAGLEDRTVEPGMVRGAYAKQRRSSAPTELKEFAGRTHWICMQPGWEEVADHAITWAEGHA